MPKYTDQAIVLKRIPYSETSLILDMYTASFGRKSFLFQGGKKKKGNMLQPFTPIGIEAYSRSDSALDKITAIEWLGNGTQLYGNPIKASILFFVNDVVAASLKEESSDDKMFQYLLEVHHRLGTATKLTNFPIWFLQTYVEQLGIHPNLISMDADVLDLQEGELLSTVPFGHQYIKNDAIKIICRWSELSHSAILNDKISKTERAIIMDVWLQYMAHHINGFSKPKSLSVIQTVLSES
jgi:DNA repair protein RecO (recombination protein O)